MTNMVAEYTGLLPTRSRRKAKPKTSKRARRAPAAPQENQTETAQETTRVCELVEIGSARLTAEAEHMAAWVERERAKGRPENELTWGNCIRETGILWRDGLRAQ